MNEGLSSKAMNRTLPVLSQDKPSSLHQAPFAAALVWAWLAIMWLSSGQARASAAALTSFEQFRSLTPEQALAKPTLAIKGVVLCYDATWNQVYFHDGQEVAWFDPRQFKEHLRVGQTVEISGTLADAGAQPAWTNLWLKVIGSEPLPDPKRVKLSQLPRESALWIETEGHVRMAEDSRGRLGFVLQDDGHKVQVYVMGEPGRDDPEKLVGCLVRIRGVLPARPEAGGSEKALIFLPGSGGIRILKQPSADPMAESVMAIDALFNRELGTWTNNLVHINGQICTYKAGEYVVVKDPTGFLRAQVTQMTPARTGQRVDLWGYLGVASKELILEDAYFTLERPSAPPPTRIAEPTVAATAVDKELTRISEIRGLRRDQARQQLPVRVRGVVTYADAEWNNAFLQDANEAVYFDLKQKDVHAGDWVEVVGKTDPGGFAPQIVDTTVQPLGRTNLPAAIKVDLDDLAGGQMDAFWVEMEGVVRRISLEGDHLHLKVATRKGSFKVLTPGFTDRAVPQQLVDARIRVRGACSSELNERGQLGGVTLHCPNLQQQLEIIEAAPPNPFAVATTAVERVATFNPDLLVGRRVKVSGVVTLRLPGRGFILQDESGGLRVNTQGAEEAGLGNAVEVVGFPALADNALLLEEAIFVSKGSVALPNPIKTSAEQIMTRGDADAAVVELEAQLIQPVAHAARPKLILQDGPIIFSASMAGASLPSWVQALRPGSLLRLAGVCLLQRDEDHQPQAFRLMLTSADSLQVLKAPPAWTFRHTLTLVVGLAVVTAFALGWAGLLRRQVRIQTEAIRKEKSLLATLIDHLPDTVYIKDKAGQYVLTNRAHAEFHGATSGTRFIGKTGKEFLPAEIARCYSDADQKVLKGEVKVFTAEEPAKDHTGATRWLFTTKVPLRDADGAITGLVGISRDITERKKSEQELREKERALSTLMGNLPGMAYRCRNDQDWTMEFLSEGCLELTGYKPADLLGNASKSYAQIIHPEDRATVWEQTQQGLREQRKYHLLYRILTADGLEKWVWEQGLGVYGPDGKLLALEGLVMDITERKKAEQRLAVFSTLGQKLSAAQTAEAVARIVVEVADQLVGWDACACALYLPENQLLSNLLKVDLIDGQRKERADCGDARPVTPWEREILESGAQLGRGSEVESGGVEVQRDGEFGGRSGEWIAAPIQNGKKVIGILSVRSEKPGRYQPQSVETLQALAEHCGGALDRIQAEAALQTSERFTRSLVESLPQNIMRKDLAGRFTFVNEFFCRTLGRPMGEILGKTDFDLYPSELARKFRQDDEEVIANGKLLTTVEENRNPAGEKTYVEVIKTPVYDASNHPIGLQVIFWDVTPRKQAEAQLAYERDLLKAILDNYPDAIYFKDLESRFVRVSKWKLDRSYAAMRARYRPEHGGEASELPAYLSSLGAFSEYLVGKTDFEFFEEERARAAFEDEQEILRTGKPLIGKVEKAVLPDGQAYWSLSTKMAWRDAEGRIIGTFGISKDITAIKEAEGKLEAVHKQLVETSRQAGMAEVASQVLHNVGNVLNSVNVSTTLLAEGIRHSKAAGLGKVVQLLREHQADLGDFITRDERGQHLPLYLEQLAERLSKEQELILDEIASLVKNVEHIKHIVAMQQSYARVAGLIETVSPTELVEDALRFNAGTLARHQVDLVRDYDPRVPAVTVDKHKVLQILTNVIRNAKYACDDSLRADKQVRIRVANGQGRVKISVADNGVGIAPENLTRIFNLGFTTRKDGHGFGLHSAAVAAKELGGTLLVRSDGLGRGATFTLELPLSSPA